jgi:hypothetical protein
MKKQIVIIGQPLETFDCPVRISGRGNQPLVVNDQAGRGDIHPQIQYRKYLSSRHRF